MELVKVKDYLVTYQRQGNDRNGNTIYIINVFTLHQNYYINMNACLNTLAKVKLDKYGNIKMTSYNIQSDIDFLISKL